MEKTGCAPTMLNFTEYISLVATLATSDTTEPPLSSIGQSFNPIHDPAIE